MFLNISQNQIDDIVNKINIVDFISKFINVQKHGKEYKSICPFHDDKNPSMNISNEKKIFKCFSCGMGGNVIKFVQEFKNLDFIHAVALLAKEANIKIDNLQIANEKPKYNETELKLFKLNKDVADCFNGLTISTYASKANEYLFSRGIGVEEINKFNIGYCPPNIRIYDFLKNLGYDQKDIFSSKLIYENTNKCVFENRIIFPILNEDGYVIGFSGRIISSDKENKYYNSSDNLIFKKSNVAYNFYSAQHEVRIKNEIIILEGFMDVISLESIGIKNSVALMGTGISEYHIKLFSKVTKNFKLFLDGDNPGINAAIKIIEKWMNKNITFSVVENNTGKDPDELVREGNINLINDLIKNAINPIDFVINSLSKKINLNNTDEVNKFLNQIYNLTSKVSEEASLYSYAKKLATLTNYELEAIHKKMKELWLKNNQNNIYENKKILKENENNFIDEYEKINSQFENNDVDESFYQIPQEFFSKYNNQENIENEKINYDEFMGINLSYKSFKERADRAMDILALGVMRNKDIIDYVEKNIDLITNVNKKIFIEKIIKAYKTNEYDGVDWKKYIETLDDEQLKKNWSNYIYYINSQHYAAPKTNLTEKAISDYIINIELLDCVNDLIEKHKKISNAKNKEMKLIFSEEINETIKKRNELLKKWRDN